MKGHELIVDILKREGIEFISLFPGGGKSGALGQIVNECEKRNLRTILARTERVALDIADGYSRASGKVSVALVTDGVGAENAFGGLAQAHADRVPLLLLAAGPSRKDFGSRYTQDFDVLHNFLKITKWVDRINMPSRISEFMKGAFTNLRTDPKGPVCLEIPKDVAAEETDKTYYVPVQTQKFSGDPKRIKEAVKDLLIAENPLLYAGEGVLYAEAWEELKELAQLLQLPVLTTLKAKGVFPENHQLSIGSGGNTGGEPAKHFLKKADLIFAVGASLTKGPGALISKDKKIIHSTVDPIDIRNYEAQHVILGDAKIVLRQVIDEIKGSLEKKIETNQALIDEIKHAKREWLEEWIPKLTSNEKPINPYRLIWDLMHTVDRENTIISPDAGWPRDHLSPFWETIIPRGLIAWGHHTMMGFSLGCAMGAKLAETSKTVINYIGDGSFGMVGMDFETAIREKIPILTVMTNNGGLGHYYKDTPSTCYLGGNYAKVAEGLGGYAERVESPDELKPAIKRALNSTKSGKAALLEVMTKREFAVTY